MRLEFKGVVGLGNPYRCDSGDVDGAIHIGDADVVDAIAEEKWTPPLLVTLNGKQIANGDCIAVTGWGYSEWTPMDSDELSVGDCDLIERLQALDGQEVHLVIEGSQPVAPLDTSDKRGEN